MICFPSYSASCGLCNVDFVVSLEDSEISHEKVSCQDALAAIKTLKDVDDPKQYLTRILFRPCGDLSKTLYPADFMTHKQFECVLRCGVKSTEKSEFRGCLMKCAQIASRIHLNGLDSRIQKDSEI